MTAHRPLPVRRIGSLQRGDRLLHYEVTGAGPALHLLYRHIDDMNASLDKLALRERLGPAGRARRWRWPRPLARSCSSSAMRTS